MIEELGRGKYKLTVNISENGKRVCRRSKTVHCGKREANKLYQEFEQEVRQQLTTYSVDKLVDSYLKVAAMSAQPTTMHGYYSCQERISSFLGAKDAAKVTKLDIEDFIADMRNKYAAKTIKNTISVLSSAFQRAVDADALLKNPCRNVKIPKDDKKDPHTYDQDELRVFLQALDELDMDTKVATELALFCGLRRSEICGLKDDDYIDGNIYVRRTRHVIKEAGEVVQKTKTVSSKRILALPEFLAADIEELIRRHSEYKTEDWLILNADRAINPNTLCTRIETLEKKHGLPIVGIHGLRHTFATMLLNSQKVDIAQISRELGHSNISTTLDIYSHATGGATKSSEQIANTSNEIFLQNSSFHTSCE